MHPLTLGLPILDAFITTGIKRRLACQGIWKRLVFLEFNRACILLESEAQTSIVNYQFVLEVTEHTYKTANYNSDDKSQNYG